MDIFRVLTRGASVKKGRGFSTDYALPSGAESARESKKEESLQNEIERETDFFHTKKRNQVNAVEDNKTKEEEEPEPEAPPLKISNEEDAANYRKINKSKVTGSDIPLPIGSFEDLIGRYQINPKLLNNLIDSEFIEPTTIQGESIPIILSDKDLIACAPTGSGKTLAYLIPVLQKNCLNVKKNSGIKTLIISPTNELATQIYQNLDVLHRGLNLKIGILSKSLNKKIEDRGVNSDKYDILVATPLRLIDLIKKEVINLSKVEHLVIDEADKLFDQGFLQQTDDILSSLSNKHLRKSMFSATIPSGVEEIAQTIMVDPIRVIIGHKEAANNTIDQKLTFTGNEEGKLLAIRQMIQQSEFKPPIIIFLQSIIRAKALYHELLYDKLNVDVIHAERTPKQRDEVIKRFKNGDIWVLITTDVLARGVDFKGINLVINYDVPQSAQSYVHRIGRTGRNGKFGKAVTFFTKEDNKLIKPIINVMKQSGCQSGYSEWMENIDKLSKNDKKQLKKHQISRKEISTVPKVVKQKRKQRDQMIEASKKRKYAQEQEQEPEQATADSD